MSWPQWSKTLGLYFSELKTICIFLLFCSVDWEDKTSSADEETDSSSLEEGVYEEPEGDDPDYSPDGCPR